MPYRGQRDLVVPLEENVAIKKTVIPNVCEESQLCISSGDEISLFGRDKTTKAWLTGLFSRHIE
jgi:hypothetical protein